MLVKSHLYIPEKYFTPELARDLVINNPEYNKKINSGLPIGDTEPYYVLYKKIERNNKVFYRVPRYALGNFSELKNKYPFIQFNMGYEVADINIKNGCSIVLNDSQKDTVKRAIEMMKKENGAFIVASPGEGKTISSIFILSEMKLKTLILVHKNFLMHQWKKALLDLTDLEEKDIGILQNGKFVDGKVVIGSMGSLMRGTIGNDINKLFGLVLCDECFVGNTKILCSNNIEKTIEDIVYDVNCGKNVFVVSYNERKRTFESKKVLAGKNMGVRKIIKIELDNGRIIKCTPDHKFLTENRGWVEAHNLKTSDELISLHT